jgi:hypothetical protein
LNILFMGVAGSYWNVGNILIKKDSLLPLLLFSLTSLLFELPSSVLYSALVLTLPATILGLS